MANNKQPEGRWVTIRGRRVFIKNDGYGEYREPNDKRQVERAKKILDSTKSDYNNAKREYLRNPDGTRYNHGFVAGQGYTEWSYSNKQAMLDAQAHLDNSQKVYDAVKHNSIKKVTWQDRDADKKDREIAARQKEIDERNGKSDKSSNDKRENALAKELLTGIKKGKVTRNDMLDKMFDEKGGITNSKLRAEIIKAYDKTCKYKLVHTYSNGEVFEIPYATEKEAAEMMEYIKGTPAGKKLKFISVLRK